jgi:hypothetical protein
MRRLGQPLKAQVPNIEAAMPEPEPEDICIQEIRVVAFPYAGVGRNAVMPSDTVMLVAVQEELAPVVEEPELAVPLPMMVIPMLLGNVIPLVQVQVPDGILIKSPLTAACVGPLMTAFTSIWLQDAAVYVPCAHNGAASAPKRNVIKTAFAVVFIGRCLLMTKVSECRY